MSLQVLVTIQIRGSSGEHATQPSSQPELSANPVRRSVNLVSKDLTAAISVVVDRKRITTSTSTIVPVGIDYMKRSTRTTGLSARRATPPTKTADAPLTDMIRQFRRLHVVRPDTLLEDCAYPSRVSPIIPPSAHPGGMAKTADPIGVVQVFSRSSLASRR